MKRPLIFEYDDLPSFLSDMIAFRKATLPGFTIASACKTFHRCSPALISNIMAGKRKLTVDRVEDIAVLCGLNAREKHYLKEWTLGDRAVEKGDSPSAEDEEKTSENRSRRRVSTMLLKHWLHPYVKDAVSLETVKADRQALYRVLGGIASRKQIDDSLKFLVQHGYLRVNAEGQWIESEPLNVVGDKKASGKIRKFHKRALDIAKAGIEGYPMEERLAQALILPLDAEAHSELIDLIHEFSEKLRSFSERKKKKNHRLYQLVLHLTPTGAIHV